MDYSDTVGCESAVEICLRLWPEACEHNAHDRNIYRMLAQNAVTGFPRVTFYNEDKANPYAIMEPVGPNLLQLVRASVQFDVPKLLAIAINVVSLFSFSFEAVYNNL